MATCSYDSILPTRPRLGRFRQTSFDNYETAPKHTYELVSSWFVRACEAFDRKKDGDNNKLFESFSFTWFAFNAWGACVTGVEGSDKKMIIELMQEQRMRKDFAMLRNSSDARFRQYTDQFAQLWPIFDVRTIKNDQHSHIDDNVDRETVIKYYLEQEEIRFSPFCWTTHVQQGDNISIDWPHTLSALYQVRCNLFHGSKIASSEHDRIIISSAFNVLAYFLKTMNYFGKHLEASY